MKDSVLDGRPISRTMMCYTVSAVAAFAEYEHSPKNGHMEKDMEMKQFRPIILNKLSGADMRRLHEAVAFLMERFPAA
jgi:hypothetical protein